MGARPARCARRSAGGASGHETFGPRSTKRARASTRWTAPTRRRPPRSSGCRRRSRRSAQPCAIGLKRLPHRWPRHAARGEGIGTRARRAAARASQSSREAASSEPEIARVSAELEAERRSLRAELETLAGVVADAEPSARARDRARARRARRAAADRRGEGHAVRAPEIARVSAALDAERAALRARARGARRVRCRAERSRAGGKGAERVLTISPHRLRASSSGGAATASEIARHRPRSGRRARGGREAAHTSRHAPPTEHGSRLETRRPSASSPSSPAASTSSSATGRPWSPSSRGCTPWRPSALARARLDGTAHSCRHRFRRARAPAPAPSGDEVAAAAGRGRRAAHAARLERAGARDGRRHARHSPRASKRSRAGSRRSSARRSSSPAAPTAVRPPGDGRFRLELRALELRMEHAEAAARENREAVLVQLERLAARIEWRFQRLESEYEARSARRRSAAAARSYPFARRTAKWPEV